MCGTTSPCGEGWGGGCISKTYRDKEQGAFAREPGDDPREFDDIGRALERTDKRSRLLQCGLVDGRLIGGAGWAQSPWSWRPDCSFLDDRYLFRVECLTWGTLFLEGHANAGYAIGLTHAANPATILRQLFKHTRQLALVASLVPLGTVGSSTAYADPPVALPPTFPTNQLFCFRITDMERLPSDVEGDAFRVQFQVLNWTGTDASSLFMSANTGTTAVDGGVPGFVSASIDANGRGGALGGSDIGPGAFDAQAIHSGRGRGDLSNLENDWQTTSVTPTHVQWDNATTVVGTPIPNRDLLFVGDPALVPGFGTDALGDSAVDGGPTPYVNQSPGGGQPTPDGSGNVLDGFVIDIDDWDVGEVFSLNWFLAASFDGSASFVPVSGGFPGNFFPIGTSGFGNDFGFGVMNLVRVEDSIGAPAPSLPGPVFVGNTGFVQSGTAFYDTVYEIPNPSEFAAEFGAGLTAGFLNPFDNVFDVNTNAIPIPEPSSIVLVGAGLVGLGASRRRRRPG